MRVTNQKNVFYIDLSKNIYKGYIETTLVREFNEKVVVFKSTHLNIESALIPGIDKELKVEFVNSKASKQKSPKSGKFAVVVKNIFQESTGNFLNQATSLNPTPSDQPSSLNNFEEAADISFPPKFSEKILNCYDTFRIRIPDNFNESRLLIRITFSSLPSNPGILWYKPVAETDKHRELIAYNFQDNASCIFPYVDCITHFDMFYIIPNTEDTKVISSGVFKSIKEEDKNIIYLYSICSHPRYLSFCAGSYLQTDIFSDSDRKKIFTPYCFENDHTEVISDLQAIIKFIESFTKTKELSTCNVVFSMLNIDNSVSKNLILLKYTLFPSPRDIEIAYYFKRALCDMLASQVYHFLHFSTYDAWIDFGFSGYLADYCIRHLLGHNEFLYTYYEDKKFIIENDIVEPPLFYTFRKEIECHSEFFKKKSKLLFHCMESQLSFAFLQKISDELLDARKIQFEPCNSPVIQNYEFLPIQDDCYANLKKVFTSNFMTIVKDSTGKDLKNFFEFYLFKPGLMKVKVNFEINKKKNSVRATMSYNPTSILPKSNKKILNVIDLKSIELEGNFDHSVATDAETIFIYHTRTKKKKKEDEEEVMPLLYIRVDPKRLNLFEYIVEQPDYMHIEQLQEKSVIGQLESIESLSKKPTVTSCEALERVIDNSHVFYKVRIRAIYALRSTSIEGYDGLQRIAQYFIKNRCVSSSTVLKGNEFGLIAYFFQKHLVKCISVLDLASEKLFKEAKFILSFYENILKFNDNSLSKFDDSWYIASVINLFTLHTVIMTSVNSATDNDFPGSDYFNNGFARLVEQNTNQFMNIDDFLFSKSVYNSKPKINNSVEHIPLIENCLDVLERFRISDLVFPSNNNIITRICLLSYIRLAFYNKIKISKECLQNLSAYPNISSIRAIAMEGLILLFSDSIKFLLNSALNELPSMVLVYLNILTKIYTLDLRVHFQDTDEFEVRLSEKIKKDLENNLDIVIEIYKINFIYPRINDLIRKLLLIIENKIFLTSELKDIFIKKYDVHKEEINRQMILKAPSSTKKLRVADLNILRTAAFEINFSLRIPKIKNYKPKPIKEAPIIPSAKVYKIKIRPKNYLVKHFGNYFIRFKIQRSKIKLRKSDIPLFLINKYRENRYSSMIDDFISNKKSTGFFPWEPKTSKQILELVKENQLNPAQTFKEIERALIFVLSYNTIVSKLYIAAKTLYNAVEHTFFQSNFIIEKITPMDTELRSICSEFLNKLSLDIRFEPFLYPVDTRELKNYSDIVRVPVCLSDISSNMESYQSFEAFITHLKRIYVNCVSFNDSRSLIVEYAFNLKAEIEKFQDSIKLEQINSIDVIKNILIQNNTENILNPVLEKIENINSWGHLDDELMILKKKHSRSSHLGKVLAVSARNVKESFKNWFLVENGRVLVFF